MSRKKIDRRVRKTEQQLQSGLAQILRKKSVDKITVSELSDLVDINRGTFYLHYQDVFDMLDQIENVIIKDFCALLTRYASSFERSSTHPFLLDAFRFIAKNQEMLHVLLCEPGHLPFLHHLQAVFKENFFDHWLEKHDPKISPEIEYFYTYILTGCMGIIIQWLNTGMKESPEQMATFTENIIFEGFKFFEAKGM